MKTSIFGGLWVYLVLIDKIRNTVKLFKRDAHVIFYISGSAISISVIAAALPKGCLFCLSCATAVHIVTFHYQRSLC